jgi:hypothetical protein
MRGWVRSSDAWTVSSTLSDHSPEMGIRRKIFVLPRPTHGFHFDVPNLYPPCKETPFPHHLSYAWQEMKIARYHLGKVQRSVEQTRERAREVLFENHLRQQHNCRRSWSFLLSILVRNSTPTFQNSKT